MYQLEQYSGCPLRELLNKVSRMKRTWRFSQDSQSKFLACFSYSSLGELASHGRSVDFECNYGPMADILGSLASVFYLQALTSA